jgi:hypothetical protein
MPTDCGGKSLVCFNNSLSYILLLGDSGIAGSQYQVETHKTYTFIFFETSIGGSHNFPGLARHSMHIWK